MNSFLNDIARIHYDNIVANPYSELQINDILFVFPNKRAGLFFNEAIKQLTQKPIFAPKICDINNFAKSISSLQHAEPLEQLFILYQAYQSVAQTAEIEEPLQFSDFCSLGNSIISDFNEVDKYLCNPHDLYKNISTLKDITTDTLPLTEEQIKIITSFWGNVLPQHDDESLSFNKQFVSIWNILLPLYTTFNDRLTQKGIGYEGMIYRNAVSQLKNDKAQLPYKRITFIGFNVFTASEYEILDHFRKKGIADYYFDYPTQYNTEPFTATIASEYNNTLKFQSIYPYRQPDTRQFPTIHTYSTASHSGQTKIASQIIDNIYTSSGSSTTTLSDTTAIVLADESHLNSLTSNLPKYVDKINITMGYPLRNTAIVSLINNLIALQNNISQSDTNPTYHHKALVNILANPYIQNQTPDVCDSIIKHINKNNLIRISRNELHSLMDKSNSVENTAAINLIKTILTPQDNITEEIKYLIGIITALYHNLKQTDNGDDIRIELEFINRFMPYLNQLHRLLSEYQVTTKTDDLASLNKSLVNSLNIQFDGEPLEGLQIMGKLEARLIDFDNIIIVGANDDNLPGKRSGNSLIPYNLRRAYNLPTHELDDAIYAYNFYRMLYRTKNLHLIYDDRINNKSEITRFFYQIKYLMPEIVENNIAINQHHITDTPTSTTADEETKAITIDKNGMLDKIQRLKSGGDRQLSPSLLKNYIQCPLQFYFKAIAEIYDVDTIDESLQANMLGNIFHAIMQKLYEGNLNRQLPKPSENEIKSLTEEAFAQNNYTITGFNKLIFNIIYEFIQTTLKFDQNRFAVKPFTVTAVEKIITDEIFNYRFKGIIDRIDVEDNGIVHIIDYKTTKYTQNEANNIITLFESGKSHLNEQFQLLLYCSMLCKMKPDSQIQPNIYNVYTITWKNKKKESSLDLFKLKIPKILLDNELPPLDYEITDEERKNTTTIEVDDFRKVKPAFEWLLEKMLNTIGDPAIPFTTNPTDTSHENCKFCIYKSLCKIQ